VEATRAQLSVHQVHEEILAEPLALGFEVSATTTTLTGREGRRKLANVETHNGTKNAQCFEVRALIAKCEL
jgi:hypothetical protein